MAVISVGVIAATALTGDFLRGMIHTGQTTDGFVRTLILDFLLAFEMCVCSHEFGVVLEFYGFWAWCAGLYLLIVWQIIKWRGFQSPCPYNHIVDFVVGSKGIGEVLARTAAILVGGVAAYRCIGTLWSLELSSLHTDRHIKTSADECNIPWSNLGLIEQIGSEALGCFALMIGPGLIAEHPTLANNDPIYGTMLIAGFILAVVCFAFEVSGGMFNPALASILIGGCRGHSMWEHVLIYWVGASAGAVVGALAYPKVKELVYKTTDNKTAKKKD